MPEPRPLRLAVVTRRYPPLIGGAERLMSYLADALADAGADVTVLTSAAPGLPAGIVPTGRGNLNLERLATSTARFVGTWRYMANLRRRLRRGRFDLAYVSMLKHDAYAALGVARRIGMPVVLRPEGAGVTGDLAWQAWGRGGRAIGRRCRQADAFVAISPAIRLELLGAGYDPSRIIDLPNGVPVPASPWQRRADWQEMPMAAFVGRLAPEKGLSTLIEAWPAVLAARPGARLVLVGEGPERPALATLIARLGLFQSVSMPGPSDDPSAILRRVDVFVLPSIEEGMSLALLEAMALGVPVIASAIPGNAALISDGTHGRLAPPGNPAAWSAALLSQWADPAAAEIQAHAARSRVIDRYSITAVARRHLELFGRLVGARGDSPRADSPHVGFG